MEDVVRVISKAIIISIVIVLRSPIKGLLCSVILPTPLIPSVFGGSGAPLPSRYGTSVTAPVTGQKGAFLSFMSLLAGLGGIHRWESDGKLNAMTHWMGFMQSSVM